jgi:hypothetical protein
MSTPVIKYVLANGKNILRGEKNTMLEEKCEINCGRATGLTYSE